MEGDWTMVENLYKDLAVHSVDRRSQKTRLRMSRSRAFASRQIASLRMAGFMANDYRR